ncbi:hypothetical protein Vadar_025459 [Vaccinium darrowii]|uniref:Uncharacterized protein n=1 Tax=Vaccinium darrowii TaxID=229202 RepID=A0ACB7ZF69_9ERIC|nr:hypothetical protein Vadar_025459 [Vaccinium darrowii]
MEPHESSPEFDGDDNGSILGMDCDAYPLGEDPNVANVGEPKAAFHAAADKAMYSEAKTERVVAKLREVEAKNDLCDDECLITPMSIDVQNSLVSPKEKQKPVGDPIKRRRRGRPPINRKQPMIEKIIKKVRQSRKKTQGQCEFKGTKCNNKLIGARSFANDGLPPLDYDGHGTHTSSTVAGKFVSSANVFGQANGTASGMAPLAHLAIYKVCGIVGCDESGILAAMDAAVEEGVDILSLSLGSGSSPFYSDVIALGAFRAIQKGIFVSCSAGTVSHYRVNNPVSALCGEGSLDDIDVKGKVVLCERDSHIDLVAKGQTVKDAGGAAMILMNQEIDGYSTLAVAHVLPATHLSFAAGVKIKEYINSTSNPMATLAFKGTKLGIKTAPMVTSFSSRGPNKQSPGILKPDIIGPGVNILAAWDVSVENKTRTTSTFNIISGTSMSCPHLSGIVALLKSAHPDWSPAAIKSAIMTTADLQNHNHNLIVDERMLPANIFATGSGHVNPSKANDPGLIYDIKPEDYIPYLCGLNYTDQEVRLITATKVKCAEVGSIPEALLNYPSFAIALGSTEQMYTRRVTNVGPANSTYASVIVQPLGVNVILSPTTLRFSRVNQTLAYTVIFSRPTGPQPPAMHVEGFLVWKSDNNKYAVKSPISVKLV